MCFDTDASCRHFECTGVHVRNMEAKSEASENEAEKCQILRKGRYLLQKVVKTDYNLLFSSYRQFRSYLDINMMILYSVICLIMYIITVPL